MQLEEEKAMRQEEADKEVNNVKFEVEAKRHELELRQKQVETMVAEVGQYMNCCGGLCCLLDLCFSFTFNLCQHFAVGFYKSEEKKREGGSRR